MNLSPVFDLMIESVYKADAKLRGCIQSGLFS